MGRQDPRVDAYILKSAAFAQPILKHLRDTVHAASDEIDEDIKWSFPHFMYKGMLCGMAAFKEHCTFGFWKGSLVAGDTGKSAEAMGQFGCIQSVADLPSKKILIGFVRKAMALNDAGVTAARKPRAPRKPLAMPADFAAALKKNKRAQAAFGAFTPSHRREYVEWITEAKRDETRARRLKAALGQIAEGKPHNWKYM
jgi:uncharacterized protein YdeI (YjbR/CyaY-like superfamily)